MVPYQFFGGEGEQHLSAVRRGAQSGAAVDGSTVIVAVAELGLAGVECHTDAQGRFQRPRLREQRLLKGAGGRYSVGRADEDGEETVPFAPALDHRASVLLDEGRRQVIVAG